MFHKLTPLKQTGSVHCKINVLMVVSYPLCMAYNNYDQSDTYPVVNSLLPWPLDSKRKGLFRILPKKAMMIGQQSNKSPHRTYLSNSWQYYWQLLDFPLLWHLPQHTPMSANTGGVPLLHDVPLPTHPEY